MAKRQVIVELSYNRDLAEMALSAAAAPQMEMEAGAAPKVPGVTFDPSFAPVSLPGVEPRTATAVPYVSGEKFDLAFAPKQSTYIVRAEVDEAKIDDLASQKAVVGVYADVPIEPTIVCPGSPPQGNDADVARLLCVPQMHQIRMDGSGVLLAIVDTGFNTAYLAAHGRPVTLDATRSWVPSPGMVAGNAPVDHGTMCAFDAAIAAPKAIFLDIQLLRSTTAGFLGFLSDAVKAYRHLCDIMSAPRRPGDNRSLVVSNSWGMFHPSWDLPVGHPGNYSDNPNHPFCRIVAALERLGADILFAAGNCGADCPDGRCQGVTKNAIYGANGHPSVLTIGGVDISKARVGYSTQGPGRLSRDKPDLCGYTHFRGSGVYSADGGTSAATPVVAGIVAAVRSKRPYVPNNPAASPASMRALIRSTAEDLGTAGFDFDHGFGVVGGCALYRRFAPAMIDCRRFPWLCRDRVLPGDICRRFPALCRGATTSGFEAASAEGGAAMEYALEGSDFEEMLAAAYQAGYYDGQHATAESRKQTPAAGDCGCSDSA